MIAFEFEMRQRSPNKMEFFVTSWADEIMVFDAVPTGTHFTCLFVGLMYNKFLSLGELGQIFDFAAQLDSNSVLKKTFLSTSFTSLNSILSQSSSP